MTSFEQTLLREVTALPEARRADVLAFVRYLRLRLMDEVEFERRYDAAIATIRETAARYATPKRRLRQKYDRQAKEILQHEHTNELAAQLAGMSRCAFIFELGKYERSLSCDRRRAG